eukprot:364522-Chlamydomonas_euryale.AAC.19
MVPTHGTGWLLLSCDSDTATAISTESVRLHSGSIPHTKVKPSLPSHQLPNLDSTYPTFAPLTLIRGELRYMARARWRRKGLHNRGATMHWPRCGMRALITHASRTSVCSKLAALWGQSRSQAAVAGAFSHHAWTERQVCSITTSSTSTTTCTTNKLTAFHQPGPEFKHLNPTACE